jgi:hypothetical protein
MYNYLIMKEINLTNSSAPYPYLVQRALAGELELSSEPKISTKVSTSLGCYLQMRSRNKKIK